MSIIDRRFDIVSCVQTSLRCVITAPTGSGKSVLVPQWLRAEASQVIVLQPRRAAATKLAEYVASQVGCPVGDAVGFMISGDCI